MSGDLVSVVIPAYNRAASIARCLQSVQAQTHGGWEAVVVDDGSADRTAELVTEIASRDERVRLVRHARNRGAPAARNTGARAARGRWITFLDSDDWLTPRSLELRLACAAAQGVEVVGSDCDVLQSDNVLRRRALEPLTGRVHRALLVSQGPTYPSLLVGREALARIGYADEGIAAFQEWDTAIRLAEHFAFAHVAEPTFVYDRRGADTISGNPRRAVTGYQQVFRKHRAAMLREAGVGALARHCHVLAGLSKAAGLQWQAAGYWLLAVLGAPARLPEFARRLIRGSS